MNKKNLYITTLLIAAILVVVNLISVKMFVRLDLTEDHSYTLSQATKDILKNLPQPVTVKAYFSKDLPPAIAETRNEFRDMLIEYSNRSKGRLVYEFINPNEDPEKEQEALKDGIQPVMINVREKDQMKQQKAYLGAVITMGDRQEVIPFMQPGGPIEYTLSSAIKKLSVTDKPKVGILEGYGCAGLSELTQVRQGLDVLYDVQPLHLTDTSSIPQDIRTLAIVRPQDSLPQYVFTQLDDFLKRGGNIFVAINRVKGDLQRAYGTALNTGLESWLLSKGISVAPDFIVDVKCGAVTVQQQQGYFRIATQVSFPYIPLISHFADHPAVKGLETVVMQFVSPLEYTGDSLHTFTPLAFTSEKANTLPAPLFFDIEKHWTEADFTKRNIPVAGVLEGKFGGDRPGRILVVGDGDFPVSRGGQQINEDNANLMVNSIDFLSDDTGLIELRTRGITSRPIKELSDTTRTVLKVTNFVLPLLLVLLYGILRLWSNRKKRMQRLEEDYS
jgi:gliding-associated putative ABC transporter substrate-binding component GldG